MRKRLEEAAEGTYPVSEIYNDLAMEFVDVNGGLREAFKDGGEVGAEYGYREAIEVAKEWLKEHSHITEEMRGNVHCSTIMTMNGMLADFEADMNKLWEEQK